MTQPELSIVIPCFNEEANVRAITAAVAAEVRAVAASYEVVLIDNHSTDGTREIVRELCREDARVRAIFNNRNYGQMRSPTYGLYQAAGRAVIGMGADFQDPPEMIPALVTQWRAGAQVVLAQRRSEHGSVVLKWVRRLGYVFLARVADHPIVPGATGFGLFDRKVIDTLSSWNEPEPFFRGMVIESGFRLAVIPFDRPGRAAGESKNGARQLAGFALSALAGSARALLRFPLLAAAAAVLVTFVLAVLALAAALTGRPTATLGWLTLGVAGFALIMLALGLIAEQLRLVAERSRNVPLVIEEERINFPAHAGR
ncbi:MAG TPA: glycosyltransferase family 2 protein [Croceibacterium sp.]|nr:glycosyltransferase family 2 protein [Croceibacterium sp.]